MCGLVALNRHHWRQPAGKRSHRYYFRSSDFTDNAIHKYTGQVALLFNRHIINNVCTRD